MRKITSLPRTCGGLLGCLAVFAFALPLFAADATPSMKIQVRMMDLPDTAAAFPMSGNAPDVLALEGIFTKEQMTKTFADEKDADVVSLPDLFARSGNAATLRMQQALRYATKYDSVANSKSLFAAREFDSKDIGIQYTATPTIGPDGFSVELRVDLHLAWLSGYAPLDGRAEVYFREGMACLLREIPEEYPADGSARPIFSSRNVTTTVNLLEGMTVVFGGGSTKDPKTGQPRHFVLLVTVPLAPKVAVK